MPDLHLLVVAYLLRELRPASSTESGTGRDGAGWPARWEGCP